MPRFLEFLIALVAFILLIPLFVVLSVAIVLDSRGWPFFFQKRIGKDGKPFWMIKFRKMYSYVPPDGKGITSTHDVRLTRMGRILERFKLDELPQIINVLLGQMALVGPRPEIERFTKYYPEKWEKVFSIHPGVIGYSQIKVPHEGDLYPKDCLNHEAFYVENILPAKLENEIEYLGKKSTWLDLSILLKVSFSLLTRTITLRWLMVHLSSLFVFLVDTVLSCLSLLVSFALVFQLGIPNTFYLLMYDVIFYSLLIRPFFFILYGLPRFPISSSITTRYILAILKPCLYSSLLLVMVLMIVEKRDLVLSAHLVDAFLLPSLLLLVRLFYISLHDSLIVTNSFQSLVRVFSHVMIFLLSGFFGFLSFWLSHMIRMQELNMNNLIPRIGSISLCVFVIRTVLAIMAWPPRSRSWLSFFKREIPRILQASLIGTGLILITYLIFQNHNYSRFSLIFDMFLYASFMTMVSMIWCMPLIKMSHQHQSRRTIIIGIGVETELFLSTIDRLNDDHLDIVGIVTEIDWKRFSSIAGFRVIGTISDLESLIEVYHPSVLVTWEWIQEKDYYNYIKDLCRKHGIELCINPSVNSLLVNSQSSENVVA